MRVHSVMTLADFKQKISAKFETPVDNIILSIGDKEYAGENHNEHKLYLFSSLGINEKTVIKLTFKEKETAAIKSRDASNNTRGKSKSGYSSSVVVTTCINNFGEAAHTNNNLEFRSRGVTQYN